MQAPALQIVSSAVVAAVATDVRNRILGWNESARRLAGWEGGFSPLGRRLFELIDATDLQGNRLACTGLPLVEESMTTRGNPQFEMVLAGAQAERLQVSVCLIVILEKGGGDECTIVYLMRPLTESPISKDKVEEAESIEERSTSRAALTARELEILRLAAGGKRNFEMASALNLSVHTVRTHVSKILQKLGVHSKAEAVSVAFQRQLL